MKTPSLRVLLVLLVSVSPAAAADPPTYWQDVRPIFRKHCTVCHSERKLTEVELSAGLALDKPELIRKKPNVLVVGKPDASLLATLLTSKDKKRAMPLDADPLPEADVAIIRKWIAAGAPEGTKPKDDTEVIVTGPAKVRKLDVAFATKAVLPKTANLPGALDITLPVGPLPPVAAVTFSPDGKLLASGIYGRVTIWDMSTAKPVKFLTNILGAVNDLKFSPKGDLLAVAGGQPSARGDLRLFDTKEWKLVHSLGGHLDTVSGVSFSPDGSKIVSASFDKTLRLWDVKTGKVLHTFTGHSDFVYAVAFGPGGEWYATASKDRTSRLIDTTTGQSRLTFSGAEQEVLAVAVRSDGQVVTSGYETQVSWWDPKTAERLKRTGGPGVAVHELAFNEKQTVLAVAGGDGSVRLFDAKTGNAGKVAQAGNAVFAVALDAEGKRAASGGADGTVKLWDVADGRLLVTLWSGSDDNWLSLAPEGYAAGADATLARAVWMAGGKPVADGKLLAPLKDATQVGKATQGQKLADPVWK
ncbi:MAG: c-type cytochrome domain-containing protein [Gemmataceae bacterium]